MTPKQASKVTLRADNHRIRSEGCWKGEVTVADISTTQAFEIFESNGAFKVILGKPWLQAVKATHSYDKDELTIGTQGNTVTITNTLEEEGHWTEKEGSEETKTKR
jgi:hypothetical protein